MNWRTKKIDLDALKAHYNSIVNDDKPRLDLYKDLLQLYTGIVVDDNFLSDFDMQMFKRLNSIASAYNAISICIDSLLSKLGKNKPRPRFLPNGGDYSVFEKAEKLEQFVLGVFQSLKVYNISRTEVLLESLLFGTGCWKIFPSAGNVEIESVHPFNIHVEKREGKDKKPKSLFETHLVDRETLKELYPESADEIEAATAAERTTGINTTEYYDELEVIEFYLTAAAGEKGKHVIFIDECILLEEDYSGKNLPYVFFRFRNIPNCFWGQGVADILSPLQLKINNISTSIDRQLEFAVGIILVEENSDVDTDTIGNEELAVITYRGTPPRVERQNPVPEQLFQEREESFRKCFEVVGVSEMSAMSKKPAGLNAAVALQEFNDIETERFASLALSYEECFIDIATLLIAAAKEIAKDEEYADQLRSTVKGEDFFESIPWTDVDLEEDQYLLSLMPASIFPTTPAGKMEKATSLMQAGLITPEEAREIILQTPDLQRFTDLAHSSRNVIKKGIDLMARTGELFELEPFDDKQYAFTYGISVYNKTKLNKAPEKVLSVIREFLMNLDAELSPPSAPGTSPDAPGSIESGAGGEVVPGQGGAAMQPAGGQPALPGVSPLPQGVGPGLGQ